MAHNSLWLFIALPGPWCFKWAVRHAQERKRYPQLIEIAARVPPNSELTKEDFQGHLAELDKSLRSVPATAQVRTPAFVIVVHRHPKVRGVVRQTALLSMQLWQRILAHALGMSHGHVKNLKLML